MMRLRAPFPEAAFPPCRLSRTIEAKILADQDDPMVVGFLGASSTAIILPPCFS